MSLPASRALSTPVTVEFEDVDAFGIVNHACLVSYLERARMRLVAQSGLDLTFPDAVPVVYELHVRYQRPLRLFDQLEVSVWVAQVDDYQLGLKYRVRRAEHTVAVARTTIAFADRETGRLVPAPAEVASLAAALGRGEA